MEVILDEDESIKEVFREATRKRPVNVTNFEDFRDTYDLMARMVDEKIESILDELTDDECINKVFGEAQEAVRKRPVNVTNFDDLLESDDSMMRMVDKKIESILDELTDDAGINKVFWEAQEAVRRPVNVTNFDVFCESYASMLTMMHKKDLLRAVSKATNHYHDQNIIKDGGSGKVYKGKLSWNGRLMYIAVWRLDRQYRENYIDFKRELAFLSNFKHDNISSIFEYFDEDDDENIIIYKHAFHGNLQGHLRNPALTWSRRLQICLGVARALNYIHNQRLIHCDINSSKILLDEDWEPKIFGFELYTEYLQSWTHRLHLSRYLDTTSVMTPKYDVYLFGVLLFEVLCGKKPLFDEDGFIGELDDIIDPSLKKQIGSQSMEIFIKIAYNCLDKELVERPSMNQIVKELEEALEQENLERPTNRDEVALWNRLLMEFLVIPLIEIESATNNFDEACIIGEGGFGIVYRAELDVLDIQSVSSIKGKSKDELSRKSKTVAIKRLLKKGDEQAECGGVLTEIDLITRCKHPNVVSLLGYSTEANEMILVYEYALNGSLSDYLGGKRSLTWSQRIQICLDVAHGINYLHTNTEVKPMIIHRDIKSDNILLDENLDAKVADFGLSRLDKVGTKSTFITKNRAGTKVYMDPEYEMTGKYKKESDIYSFGVVLFEVLSGKMAYDGTYMREDDDGLAPIVRRRFNERTLTELIDPKMLEEDDEDTFTLNRGPTQDSFDLFSKVGYECLAKTQAQRPKMEVVVKTLEDALKVQGEAMVLSRFRLSSIEFATQNFAKTYYMGLDTYGKVYKAQLDHLESNTLLATKGKNNGEPPKRRISVAIKRISGRENEHGEKGFFSEIEMHTRYKHPNIVPLLGFCCEGDNMLLVYEHASNESLDNYLRDTDKMTKHTWIQRLHLCLGIARGLNHLHTLMDRKQEMMHVDIRSANILLGKSGEAKIAYFGFSKLLPANQEASTDTTNNNIRTKVYCYPEYQTTGKLKKQSDIYSFGVVLFEIFCGRLAYDPVYRVKNDNGLAPIARRCFSDGTIKEMIDPALKEQTLEDILTSNREPILDSLGTYLRIADQCLAENQAERPTMQIVIKELEIALNIQENFIKSLQISFKDVESATGNFSQKNCFGSGRYWKAYKGELRHSNANLASASASGGGGTSASASASVGPSSSAGPSSSVGPTASDANANTDFIVAKRWDSESNQGDHQFRTELSIIIKRKHENIIGLVGYCHEMDERIIVYEQASKGSLDMYLNDATLTWMKRIKICTDVARALEFLHEGDGMLKKVVHRNIQSPAILLNDDWKAKISNLEMSSLDSPQQEMEHVSNNAYGAFGYLDPEYNQGYLTEKSDIYSFGVVMFEILCGRLAWSEGFEDHYESLGPLAKRHYEEGKLDEMVFKGIKEQIGPVSMAIYADIAYQCLHDIREKRPTAGEVVLQLKKVLDLQEDYEKWQTKLHDYKEIVQMAGPKIYSTIKGKDLYNMLYKGITIDEGKLWFSIGSNGEKNVMVASSQFSYENHNSHKWRSDQESRFHEIADISDISNLKIHIKIRTQYLSANINYGVHLVFRFCDARKSLAKQMYVNLTYKMRNETLNAYLATWREDEWMRIELYRFLNDKEDTDFEFLLESFSRCDYGSGGIYVEGVEIRAIDNEEHEENENLKEVLLNSNPDPMQSLPASVPYDICSIFTQTLLKLFSWRNEEKYYMLSAMKALCDSSNAELFDLKRSTESRFGKVIELRSTQVFLIKCKIESERLLPNTEYMCHLVFKLSEKCCGLHCPVIVRDLHQQRNKKTGILYFKTPHPWNVDDVSQCPKEREDGWLEVNVWKFKSELQSDCISINLELKTYEGTMSGLVICGLEFRPT